MPEFDSLGVSQGFTTLGEVEISCRCNGRVAEWVKATDCKSVPLRGYEGSNPSLPTITRFVAERSKAP